MIVSTHKTDPLPGTPRAAVKTRGFLMTVSKKVYRTTRNIEFPIALVIGIMACFAFDSPAREIVNCLQEDRNAAAAFHNEASRQHGDAIRAAKQANRSN